MKSFASKLITFTVDGCDVKMQDLLVEKSYD